MAKVKWRQHEFILVTIITCITGLRSVLSLLSSPLPFSENFKFYQNILLLQAITLLIQYGCYIWLNRFVIAKLAKPLQQPVVTLRDGDIQPKKPGTRILRYAWLVLQFIAIIYLLGPVSNFAAYYCTEGFPDKGIVNAVSSFFPPHPQPTFNVFGGFDITMFFVCIYLVYVLLRETTIYFIERASGRKAFSILVANQVTLLIVIYLSVFPILLIFSAPVAAVFMGQSTVVMYFFAIPAAIAVALVNIYWLFPLKGERSLLTYKTVRRLLLITALGALPFMLFQRAQIAGLGLFFILGWALHLLVTTPVSWIIYQQRKEKILQVRGMEQALSRSKADMQFLRSQINPHFLFNTLNTLYGTALQEGSTRTAEGIQMLGDMMRFMLHENNRDTIQLSRELEYMHNYITLQKLRIQQSPNITIETNINGEGCYHSIAPMLLMPLVENAFKHGISLVEPSWIKIELACNEKSLRFTVNNSMHTKQDNDTERDKSGIGLQNVADRLAILYPGRYAFNAEGDGREFTAVLYIQF